MPLRTQALSMIHSIILLACLPRLEKTSWSQDACWSARYHGLPLPRSKAECTAKPEGWGSLVYDSVFFHSRKKSYEEETLPLAEFFSDLIGQSWIPWTFQAAVEARRLSQQFQPFLGVRLCQEEREGEQWLLGGQVVTVLKFYFHRSSILTF